AAPDQPFHQKMEDGRLFLINETFLKIYVEYSKNDGEGAKLGPGTLTYGFDSAAAETGKRWLASLGDVGMIVDLGPLKRLMRIRGTFDAKKGISAGFVQPEIEFSKELKPVMDL